MNSLLQSTPIIAVTLLVVGLGVFAVKMLERELRDEERAQRRQHRA